MAGSGRFFSLLNEKRFIAALAAGALPESVLEHQPRPAGLAVSFRPGTRGPGGGSLSGGCVQSAPGRPLPSDPAHPPCSPPGLQNPGCVLTPCRPGLWEKAELGGSRVSPQFRPSGTDFIFAELAWPGRRSDLASAGPNQHNMSL